MVLSKSTLLLLLLRIDTLDIEATIKIVSCFNRVEIKTDDHIMVYNMILCVTFRASRCTSSTKFSCYWSQQIMICTLTVVRSISEDTSSRHSSLSCEHEATAGRRHDEDGPSFQEARMYFESGKGLDPGV